MEEHRKTLIRSVLENAGVNVQTQGIVAPEENQRDLMLYIIEEDGLKSFLCKEALTVLLTRKSYGIAYGTTKPDGKKCGIVIVWE